MLINILILAIMENWAPQVRRAGSSSPNAQGLSEAYFHLNVHTAYRGSTFPLQAL